MREHLYKAKRANWRELPKEEWWVEGYYFCMTHTDGRHSHHFIMPIGADLSIRTPIEKIQIEVEPETVCEYTGLHDKNGIKIFEGSIVRRTDLHTTKEPSVGFIEYDIENTAFLIHWTDVQNYSATFPWKDKIEVIGNIYDNPELLKEESAWT